jgi:hypothetical protein
MKSLLDANFRYTPSDQTDIRKTFARAKREMKRTARDALGSSVRAASNDVNIVTPLWPNVRRSVS